MSRSVTDSVAPAAIGAAVIAMAILVLGYVVDPPDEDALRQFLVITAIIAVATVLTFGLVIPRTLARGGSAKLALALSLLGLLTVAAYWSGLPPALAVGGVVLGRRSEGGADAGLARAAVAIGVTAIFAEVAVFVADAVLNA